MADAEYLVVASSLRAGSFSRIMASALVREYEALSAGAALVDMRDHPLPLCDGETAYSHPSVPKLSAQISRARVIVVSTPIYNYDANAVAKNLVELTGRAWENKIVGFLCAAGGSSSYMSVIGLANSLMLDFRCVILPRFVYATTDDFAEGRIVNAGVQQRIRQLAQSSMQLRQS